MLLSEILHSKSHRKVERFSPKTIPFFMLQKRKLRKKASFFASLRGKWRWAGSLTVESAVALPVFLACMAFFLQAGNVYDAAVRLSSAMTESAEQMAAGAYATEFGEVDSFLGTALTVGYASAGTFGKTGEIDCVRNGNFFLSSFLEEDDCVDLILTWQMKSPTGLVRAPWNFYLQRSCVRAWTGRKGSEGKGAGEDEDSQETRTVYVTENGTVYHTDANCTHIRLSIRKVEADSIPSRRNQYGEKYHACELCGGSGNEVYITKDGNRYHSSLECSGLKRTVKEVSLEDAGDLRPCSRCACGHDHTS